MSSTALIYTFARSTMGEIIRALHCEHHAIKEDNEVPRDLVFKDVIAEGEPIDLRGLFKALGCLRTGRVSMAIVDLTELFTDSGPKTFPCILRIDRKKKKALLRWLSP